MKTPQKCASGQTAAHKYCHLKLQTSSQILVFTAKNYKNQIKVKQTTDAHLDASQVPFFVKTERSSFYQDNQEIFYTYIYNSRPGRVRKPVCQSIHNQISINFQKYVKFDNVINIF
jgi:hypothetical protein